jgi:DNA-binding GntR family transcriptional regulator
VRAIRRARLVDDVASVLRDAIARGDLPPGARLVQDHLAAQLGVSRTPLRDALHKLEYEGLVTLSKGRGVQVRQLDPIEAVDLYEVREVIDGLAARLAAARATPTDVQALRRVLRDMERAVEPWNPHRWLQANLRFHEGVVAAARSPALAQLVTVIQNSARTFYPSVLLHPERARIALAEHSDILNAIAARDTATAERLGRDHIASAKALLASMITEGARPVPSPGRHRSALADRGAGPPSIRNGERTA